MTPFSVVEGPEAWKAADYQDLSKFMYVFSDSDIAELDSAIAAVQERDSICAAATETSGMPAYKPHVVKWPQGV